MKRFKFLLALLLVSTSVSSIYCSEEKSVFMGVLIVNNDASIPTFLKTIEALDYDKKLINMRVDILNQNPEIQKKIHRWCTEQEKNYAAISCESSNRNPTEVKSSYLKLSQAEDVLFFLSSDVFLKPFTLQFLVNKNLPIVAPLLRPLPKPNDPYRNFYMVAGPKGFFVDNPNHNEMADWKLVGTFPADCVHGAYVIQTKFCDRLAFDNSSAYDFVAFSNVARKAKVSQNISNEREFGFFINHDQPKDLVFPYIGKTISKDEVKAIASKYMDKYLALHIEIMPIDLYSLYTVGDDVYWVDEKFDWIKSYYIKKGSPWEPHVEEKLKQYAKPGSTVIDVGGHIGTHTISLSRHVGPNGSVETFEPQIKLFTELLVNTAINNCKNVHHHRVALGSEEKDAKIGLPCNYNEGMGKIGNRGERVEMKTLDSFGFTNVSLIKMDIEGHELEALLGGLDTILRDKPVMIVEIFDDADLEQKLKFVKALGYNVSLLSDKDYLCIPD